MLVVVSSKDTAHRMYVHLTIFSPDIEFGCSAYFDTSGRKSSYLVKDAHCVQGN